MKRLYATILCDIKLQFRNGFYYAAAFVAVTLSIALSLISEKVLTTYLPLIICENMIVNTFYFIAGLVLLEKEEGTLEVQVITPLRSGEYIASKVITLTLLSLVENMAIVWVAYDFNFNWLPLVFGILLLSPIYALAGFVAVSRYEDINSFLMPSVVYTMVLSIPLVYYLGFWDSYLFFLHPMQAPLLLMQAAFQPLTPWQWIYILLYPIPWIGFAFFMSLKTFQHFIIKKQGAK